MLSLTTALERTALTCHFSSRSHLYQALQQEMPTSQKSSSHPNKKLSKGKGVPSSNWLNLQKALDSKNSAHHETKKPKLNSGKSQNISNPLSTSPEPLRCRSRPAAPKQVGSGTSQGSGHVANDNSRTSLRSMALALEEKFSDDQRLPGRYLALDCEMVGVGISASESSLARVSLVNYHGVVIIDEYVKQRERVVDYRTPWSGIRASDMINAKPFKEVQNALNELLDGRILIGHAVYNDLKALLLSHPTRQTRDTQSYAYKFALTKSRHISLKNLAKQELGIDIQTGEHSSVVDARTTMAIYRLYKKDWERASGTISQIPGPETTKRKRSPQVAETNDISNADGESTTLESNLEKEEVEDLPPTSNTYRRKRAKTNGGGPTISSYPGGGRKGVSSGMSIVVRRGERGAAAVGKKATKSRGGPWWKSLPSGGTNLRLDN